MTEIFESANTQIAAITTGLGTIAPALIILAASIGVIMLVRRLVKRP